MSDRVLLPFGNLVVPMTLEELAQRAVPVTDLLPAPVAKSAHIEPASASDAARALLTPEECAARSHTSRLWWIRKARRKEIACTRVGRLVRFTPEQFAEALSSDRSLDHGITDAAPSTKPLENKALAKARNKKITAKVARRSPAATSPEGAA